MKIKTMKEEIEVIMPPHPIELVHQYDLGCMFGSW